MITAINQCLTPSKALNEARDVSEAKIKVNGKITVIGGGLVGVEVAETLVITSECDVTIVEMIKGIGTDLDPMRSAFVWPNMYEPMLKCTMKQKPWNLQIKALLLKKMANKKR